MSILRFTPQDHKYTSIDVKDTTNWLSVTSFISNFKQPFDADTIAVKSAKNKKSKWYGMTPEDIKEAWKSEAKRATDLGTWYHNQRETDICEIENMERHGFTIPIFKPIEKEGIKYSPEQKLKDGVYPEHMVYLRSAGVCGQSDLVEVVNGVVHITDYKTNKEIKVEGFTNWEGKTQKMSGPVSHLDDCHLNHYALQLSMYMYIILKHNPKLSPGILTIHHILFEEAGRDVFDNPISARDTHGNPIVTDIVQYDLPYLKQEAIGVIHWLEDNRDKLKAKP
jgi:ATP-dependent exoDNAse (exonuclease V) beta subunit